VEKSYPERTGGSEAVSRRVYRYVQGSAVGIALLATIAFRGSGAFTIKPLSKEEDEMKRETMKTIDAIRNSMLTKLDHMKDTANDAEQDVAQVMKDFIYSLNKEQRRNDRIRKVQYIAIGIGATAAVIGLAGFLLMPKKDSLEVKKVRKDIEQTVDQVGQKIEDSGRYLKYKTEETAAHISDKTRHAVDHIKKDATDNAESFSDKTRHAVDHLKENAANTAETISDKTEHAVNTLKEKTAETYENAKDKMEYFGEEVKDTAKQVKKEWEKPVQPK